jgi:hypothetical protein
LRAALERPADADAALLGLARRFRLTETDAVLASIAAWSDEGRASPTLAEAAEMLHAAGWLPDADPRPLGAGALCASGWLQAADGVALAQQPLRLARPLALALLGQHRPPTPWREAHASVPLPPGWGQLARRIAQRLAQPARPQVLVLRHAPLEAHGRAEAVSWLVALAGQLGHRVVGALPGADELLPPWLAAWLDLTRSLWLIEATAGDMALELPALPDMAAPLLVLAPPQRPLQPGLRELVECTLPEPPMAERARVWRWALKRHGAEYSGLDAELAQQHRLGPGAICSVAEIAAAGLPTQGAQAVRQALPALGRGLVQDLGQWLDAAAAAPALVVPPAVERQLATLEARCRQRDRLPERLAPTARARASRGVKALLHGPPGTGKTLAAEWLAARLGKPLLRVDTAAVLSKYIGETERNLDRVMAAAETCDAVLLFDEADALFARRTEVGNANDRYANAQTSFLLQRLEAADGITVLTSNGRQRFDEAFTRRLDHIVEFTAPTPAERLRLWRALLGDATPLTEAECQRLAVDVEASGGALRNAVVTATVLADGRAPGWDELAVGVALECAKAQRPAPAWAQAALSAWSAGARP